MSQAVSAGRARPSAQEPALVVEHSEKAGLVARLAHTAFRLTVRPALGLASAVLGSVNDKNLLWIPRLLDPCLFLMPPIRGTHRRRVQLLNCRAEWVWHDGTPDPGSSQGPVVLYFHGGGFTSCGLNTHRRLASDLAKTTGAAVLNVDYQQLPSASFADTLQDAVEAYEWLLASGRRADQIAFGGDSAGGGLAFRAAIEVRDLGIGVPGAVFAFSPWADLDCAQKAIHPNHRLDPLLSAQILGNVVKVGLAKDGLIDPSWSSVNHDFAGLPPASIHVGSTECLLPDAELLAKRLGEAGVPCSLKIWDRQIHVFPAGAVVLPEARAALEEVGQFVRSSLASA
ncbi:alpha/beta hydrolase [Segniliparus rugosus]|uniref:Alpha/beta hydrolase fold-3 domain-containing protein n=1 Tax=Segniliparus rugosus (strain ATCC BAA-974 / DSM 45345 / CCUG 50838 / CIP 108380 / JCM 13579 / CDC 945) TaxID=679197 RepID=E5XR72_SEGRC|nr:alpha/beta hydrolase [Segniliparus rugosus]EFV13165.1 hypothetical protein HMPREF9336_01994 [Segniliparus rugosus ATCC BAA-974]